MSDQSNVAMHPTLIDAFERALNEKHINQYREIAEQTRDDLLISFDPKGDQDIKHRIRETHIIFGAVCALNAAEELQAAVSRADDLERTFDIQWKAHMRAVEKWQLDHPGNELVLPDMAELTEWLLAKAFPELETPSPKSGGSV